MLLFIFWPHFSVETFSGKYRTSQPLVGSHQRCHDTPGPVRLGLPGLASHEPAHQSGRPQGKRKDKFVLPKDSARWRGRPRFQLDIPFSLNLAGISVFHVFVWLWPSVVALLSFSKIPRFLSNDYPFKVNFNEVNVSSWWVHRSNL